MRHNEEAKDLATSDNYYQMKMQNFFCSNASTSQVTQSSGVSKSKYGFSLICVIPQFLELPSPTELIHEMILIPDSSETF